ncbi:DoxX family protein [Diaminobutyricimonas sp. TR449]|uniref:DoxX family protein n=1 Tax=Diaminobutyricimonas sp. TR449 TaxID=2708076 RepID=UPI001422F6B4|nr:DoxX family protein [Diaminobutyricimonas sp. TR449]
MDIGILLLRLILAFILFAHSTQKLFGWFQGPGLPGATALFEKLGQRPARQLVLFASLCEATAAASLLVGFLTPLGVAIGVGAMLVAGMTLIMFAKTFWNVAGGGEYPIVLAAAIAIVGFTGPGAYSADVFLNLPWTNLAAEWQFLIGAGALLLAVLAATGPLMNARSHLGTKTST